MESTSLDEIWITKQTSCEVFYTGPSMCVPAEIVPKKIIREKVIASLVRAAQFETAQRFDSFTNIPVFVVSTKERIDQNILRELLPEVLHLELIDEASDYFLHLTEFKGPYFLVHLNLSAQRMGASMEIINNPFYRSFLKSHKDPSLFPELEIALINLKAAQKDVPYENSLVLQDQRYRFYANNFELYVDKIFDRFARNFLSKRKKSEQHNEHSELVPALGYQIFGLNMTSEKASKNLSVLRVQWDQSLTYENFAELIVAKFERLFSSISQNLKIVMDSPSLEFNYFFANIIKLAIEKKLNKSCKISIDNIRTGWNPILEFGKTLSQQDNSSLILQMNYQNYLDVALVKNS